MFETALARVIGAAANTLVDMLPVAVFKLAHGNISTLVTIGLGAIGFWLYLKPDASGAYRVVSVAMPRYYDLRNQLDWKRHRLALKRVEGRRCRSAGG